MGMFQHATKKKQKARVALVGPPGSGKTFTALTLAKHLGSRIAVIDTERGSASKYAGDVASFDVCEPEAFAPDAYIKAMHGAAEAGYDVLVIDSLSHAWEGEGGILDQVDQRGGKFEAWKHMSPQTRHLIDAILQYPGHVIATMRVKTEYVVEKNERTQKMEPRKVGLAPKFKEGLEYEFDVVGMLDDDNVMRVTKSRASALNGASIAKPGKPFADALRAWLEDGIEATKPAPKPAAASDRVVTLDTVSEADELVAYARLKHASWSKLANGQREKCIAAVTAAAERVGADPAEVLAAGGVA